MRLAAQHKVAVPQNYFAAISDSTPNAGPSCWRTGLAFPTSPVCSRESGILSWHQDHRPAPLAVSASRRRQRPCSLPVSRKAEIVRLGIRASINVRYHLVAPGRHAPGCFKNITNSCRRFNRRNANFPIIVVSRSTNISAFGSNPWRFAEIEHDEIVGLIHRQHGSADGRMKTRLAALDHHFRTARFVRASAPVSRR